MASTLSREVDALRVYLISISIRPPCIRLIDLRLEGDQVLIRREISNLEAKFFLLQRNGYQYSYGFCVSERSMLEVPQKPSSFGFMSNVHSFTAVKRFRTNVSCPPVRSKIINRSGRVRTQRQAMITSTLDV